MSIETDALDALYAQIKPKGVTMTALLAKAIGVALAAHPLLYATLSADATQVTYNEKARSTAAAAQHGLLACLTRVC
jgi:pyruvate dehydrogenase E2 component (dihydrolipoamide acetyltransferase)